MKFKQFSLICEKQKKKFLALMLRHDYTARDKHATRCGSLWRILTEKLGNVSTWQICTKFRILRNTSVTSWSMSASWKTFLTDVKMASEQQSNLKLRDTLDIWLNSEKMNSF
jgi:antibiotic biosynthesis monooxygenase (ABM) superfamily enzyme